ncbi:cytochrome P450 [Cadophora sp. DSE1049]|nr:cytochrome P450 [Cadophora sp. DSE1049]
MGLHGALQSYELIESQYKLVIFATLLSLPGLVEAPSVPYFVPFVGNLLAFATNAYGILSSITRDYNGIPVKLKLGPEKVYIITGVENIRHIFNKSRELSTKALTIKVLVHAFGMPSSDTKVYEDDDSGLYLKPAPGSNVAPVMRLLHKAHHQFSKELTGTSLAELSRQFVRGLALQINRKGEEIADSWIELPDIFEFVRDESFTATTTALCGDHILRLNPDFASNFWEFDSCLRLMLQRVPRLFIPKAYAIRDKCQKQVAIWHAFADKHVDCCDESLSDVLWEPFYGHRLMRERAKMYKATHKFSDVGRAASDLGMIWGANANVVPSASWSLIYILSDESLTARLREEIAPAFPDGTVESVDMAKLNSCPLLQSVISEVLRLNVAVMINRTSMVSKFRIGNWFVKPDKTMLICPYFSHRDEAVWNTGRTLPNGKQEHPLDDFWAERFLEYPNDPLSGPTKKTADLEKLTVAQADIFHDDKEAKFTLESLKGIYLPFGGGTNMCPGQHYAKNEMVLVVAMLLWAFDIEFLDPRRAKLTRQNMKAFPSSTLRPDRENPIRLRVRRL